MRVPTHDITQRLGSLSRLQKSGMISVLTSRVNEPYTGDLYDLSRLVLKKRVPATVKITPLGARAWELVAIPD